MQYERISLNEKDSQFIHLERGRGSVNRVWVAGVPIWFRIGFERWFRAER